jgi:hypothetical protein
MTTMARDEGGKGGILCVIAKDIWLIEQAAYLVCTLKPIILSPHDTTAILRYNYNNTVNLNLVASG